MELVYFGDGLWATKCLRSLLDEKHRVLGVVLRRRPSDDTLRELAEAEGIPVRVPARVNDEEFVAWVRSLRPRLNVSMSYDQILRRPMLAVAPLGFINCHAGKLPFYRGRSVVNWALINGEEEIGLTVHYVDEGIDTGDILLQRALPLQWEDDYGSVLAKLEDAFPSLLAEALRRIESGDAERRPQSHLEGTYFSARVPGDEWLDWGESSLRVYNKIRAITRPGPGARTWVAGRELIVWRARYGPDWPRYIATAGVVVGLLPGRGVKVKTGDSTVLLESVQFADEPEPRVPSFRVGTRFGRDERESRRRLLEELDEMRGRLVRLSRDEV